MRLDQIAGEVSNRFAAWRKSLANTTEKHLAAVKALGVHPVDQSELRYMALRDPHPAVRIVAAEKVVLIDFDPLLAMSDDAAVRLIFANKSRLKDVLVAMDLCDPDKDVKAAAAQSLAREAGLVCIDDDQRAAAYYLKFGP